MNTSCNRCEPAHSRRDFLFKSSFGFGALALTYLLDRDSAFSAEPSRFEINPLIPKAPQFAAKAKRVIYVFLQGGPSHIDLFDPKPELNRLHGQPVPPSFQLDGLNFSNLKAAESKLMGSRFEFRKYGKSGLEVSELFQNIAQHADDLAVIRSCYHESFVHGPSLNLLYSGSLLVGHPSVGAWVVYGLGSETQNLPAFMVMTDGGGLGSRLPKRSFGSGYLPAIYQGTFLDLRPEESPILNLVPPPAVDAEEQKSLLSQINNWNRQFRESRQDDTRLAAQIYNYELAFRMQTAAPDLLDLSGEPARVRDQYGLDREPTAKFGRMCLLARRMVERGVRFVQLVSTDWDGHSDCEKNHRENAAKIDLPMAALMGDLKQRGLLESTLIVLIGEFGRTPVMQGKEGRDHHPYGFSFCMAGGGIRGGKVIGATDELGFRAVEDKVHVHDMHATMMSLLGLDHKGLTFLFQGRDRRLTDVGGENDLAQRLTGA